jgi:hypothetical protein
MFLHQAEPTQWAPLDSHEHRGHQENDISNSPQTLRVLGVMSFGFTNMPALFQSLMNDVLVGFIHDIVLIFFDDILIYNKS